MCMAAEWRVVEIMGALAVGERQGVRRKFSIMLLPDVKVGDWVLVHAGFAMAKKISSQEV